MTPTTIYPEGVLSPEQAAEFDRLMSATFFLVRIAGNGDVWRCKRCNCKHDYLTRFCVERPWSGITGGLYAYYKTIGTYGAESYLSPREHERFTQLERQFGATSRLQDLATSHPQMARTSTVSGRELEIGAAALGILEPITSIKAHLLADLINTRARSPIIRL